MAVRYAPDGLVQTGDAQSLSALIDDDRMAATAPADDGLVVGDILLLRPRALLARVRGDEAQYRNSRDRHRAIARSLGFERNIAWDEVMT